MLENWLTTRILYNTHTTHTHSPTPFTCTMFSKCLATPISVKRPVHQGKWLVVARCQTESPWPLTQPCVVTRNRHNTVPPDWPGPFAPSPGFSRLIRVVAETYRCPSRSTETVNCRNRPGVPLSQFRTVWLDLLQNNLGLGHSVKKKKKKKKKKKNTTLFCLSFLLF